MDRKVFLNYVYLHGLVFIFALTGPLGKAIQVESGLLVWYRVLIGIGGIVVYFLVRRRSITMPRDMVIKTLGVGLFTAAHWVCFFESIKQANVSVSLVCISVTPFLISFLEPLLFRRRYRIHEGLLGIAAVVGIGSIFQFESGYTAGVIIGLLSASFCALFVMINARLVVKGASDLISFYELIGAWLALSVYTFAFEATPLSDLAIRPVDFAYLVVLGLLCTSFAYAGGVYVMRVIPPFSAMLIVNLEPVYGIALAVFVFGESEYMSAGFYFGAAVILASIVLNSYIARRVRRLKSEEDAQA